MRAALASLALAVAAGAAYAGVTRGALGVGTRTCVAAQATFGKPFPCLHVDLGGHDQPGFAVLKAPLLRTEVVVMPTERIVGLEDRSLRRASGAVYWRAATEARHFVTDALQGRLDISDVAFAASATIDQLVTAAGVSPATITRFARAAGCDDIRDLRMKLAQASAPVASGDMPVPGRERIHHT